MEIDGPLAPWAEGMKERLRELGYTPVSTRNLTALVAALSRYLQERALGAADVTPMELDRFCSALREAGRSAPTPKSFGWLVQFLKDVGVEPAKVLAPPSSETDELLERYCRFLHDEHGLLPLTVATYVQALKPFLAQHADRALGDLTTSDVSRFMTQERRQLSSRGLERAATSLRSFFRFALVAGLILVPLANAVPSAARWSVSSLPQGPPVQVKTLLDSCDRATPLGRRDYAILILLVRLGLRAAEVAALCLGDIDWRAGEVVVRGKGSIEERLPLPADVGKAIAIYLRRDPTAAPGTTSVPSCVGTIARACSRGG